MAFVACLPLIEADLPAVLALDQHCLGGLWTRSGYQKELGSDCSDLVVLVSAPNAEVIQARRQLAASEYGEDLAAKAPDAVADAMTDGIKVRSHLTLLGSGCLWAVLEEAHITTLAIDPQYQGQKLGLLLLSELLLCALARGLTRATLEVRASNQKALQLYQKFHFKEAGQRKKYYSDGESARILWRSGLQTQDCKQQVKRHQAAAMSALHHKSGLTFLNA